MSNSIDANALDVEREMQWLNRLIEARLDAYFMTGEEATVDNVLDIAPPVFKEPESQYGKFINQFKPNLVERAALALALAPHVRPRLLDVFFTRNKALDRQFTEFGGDAVAGAFIPTGQTLAFVLAAEDLSMRFRVMSFLSDKSSEFARLRVIRFVSEHADHRFNTTLNRPLVIGEAYLALFTTGEPYSPEYSEHFPATEISADLDWDDLVLEPRTIAQLDEIKRWLTHSPELLENWGFKGILRPGYRALFYGAPGTGKTLTASLLGKYANKPVYKIDLSRIVSKYIGETEKNLASLFDVAHNKDWILFFDEADALFGKRTQTKDSHDRYANQEVSYLLQRIEAYEGIAILATNMKDNIDSAFLRRFESVIHFPLPDAVQRLRLWKRCVPPAMTLGPKVSLTTLANDHELTGASIVNIVRDACILAIEQAAGNRKSVVMTAENLQAAIYKEFNK